MPAVSCGKNCWLALLFVVIFGRCFGQSDFESFFTLAKQNNSELVSLQAQKKFLELQGNIILASNKSPKVYLSSEFLFAPYLNNNGRLISTDPDSKAIGYDAGITNGGLYAFLLNVEYPVFNRGQVNNLLGQNSLEIRKAETKIKTLEVELRYSLLNNYYDVLLQQSELVNLRHNLNLLKAQLDVLKTLSEHGLYKYVDYRLMKTTFINDSINLMNAENNYRLGLNQLRSKCGISDTSLVYLDGFVVVQKIVKVNPDSSIYSRTYTEDSLSSVWQQRVFENQYKPQVKLYANSGLNSSSVPYMDRHVGMSAGAQLTYTLFDGRQKEINRQQQMVLMDAAIQQRELQKHEIQNSLDAYNLAIENAEKAVNREARLDTEYNDLLSIYTDELKVAGISIVDYLNFLQQYNQNKLSLEKDKINQYKLINEYNYRNH